MAEDVHIISHPPYGDDPGGSSELTAISALRASRPNGAPCIFFLPVRRVQSGGGPRVYIWSPIYPFKRTRQKIWGVSFGMDVRRGCWILVTGSLRSRSSGFSARRGALHLLPTSTPRCNQAGTLGSISGRPFTLSTYKAEDWVSPSAGRPPGAVDPGGGGGAPTPCDHPVARFCGHPQV